MNKTYRYTFAGKDSGKQTWKTEGQVTCDYPEVWEQANLASFQKLTRGEAVYGYPGLGCSGPYSIEQVTIERIV